MSRITSYLEYLICRKSSRIFSAEQQVPRVPSVDAIFEK